MTQRTLPTDAECKERPDSLRARLGARVKMLGVEEVAAELELPPYAVSYEL